MSIFKKPPKDKHRFKPLLIEIEDRPLNPIGRGLLWVVVIFMIIAALWLYFAKVDVVVSARGQVIPDGEIKVIQPTNTGVISDILVNEGDSVTKGQVLVNIDPTVTSTNLFSKKRQKKILELEIDRLNALINNQPFKPEVGPGLKNAALEQQQLFHSMKQSYLNQLGSINQQYKQAQSDLETAMLDSTRLKTLFETYAQKQNRMSNVRDIIAAERYEQVCTKTTDYQKKYEMKTAGLEKLRAKLRELRYQKKSLTEEFTNKWYEKLIQKEKQLNELKAQIETIQFQNRKQKLRSPVDGYIGKKTIHTVGGVVKPAQELLTVVPKSVPSVIRVKVLNKDIGFVKEGMNTAVKIDTFNFQKYGLVEGKVVHIANDAIKDEKLGPVYEVYIKPKKQFMQIKGEKVPLTPGMSVTGEMKVGKRRIIEFFIYPVIKYLDEGMSVR